MVLPKPFHRPLKIKLAPVKRKCLRCGKKFLARGKFNRVCPICTERNKELCAGSLVGYWIFPHWPDGP